jgi:predicted permease
VQVGNFAAGGGAFAGALPVRGGLAPGLRAAGHASGRDTAAIVREGGRGNTAGRARHRMRRLLIVTQMATAVVLLVASGLLVRSAGRLAAVDPGFDADNVVTAGVTLGAQPDRDRAAATYRAVLAEMARLPGVESVGATSALPVGPAGLSGGSFEIKSRPTAEAALPPFALYTSVTSGYFETLRIPLVQGRLPEPGDSEQHRPIVWVNRTFASNFLGDRAVGDSIKFDQQWHEIVGVVGDVKTFDLREPARAMAYLPLGDPLVGTDAMYAVIRTRDNVALPASALRASVDAVDRSAPLTTIRTMKEIVDSSVAQTSFTMVLLTIAALTALGLGVVGLYGVISYVVAQRTAEIGIRLALGARPANVYGLVLGQGLAAALTGVVIGLAGAAASARLIRSLLFEVSARDPATYAAAAIILTLVSLIATYVPARRAAAIDPSAALRM